MPNWKTIARPFEKYEVSDTGLIRSNWRKPKLLKPAMATNGHLAVGLYTLAYRETRLIHHLVLEAFLDERRGRFARHLDGDPRNCAISNLTWMDRREYVREIGVALSYDEIFAIKTELAKGYGNKEIGIDFMVSDTTISEIRSGERWTDVPWPAGFDPVWEKGSQSKLYGTSTDGYRVVRSRVKGKTKECRVCLIDIGAGEHAFRPVKGNAFRYCDKCVDVDPFMTQESQEESALSR